MEWKIEERAEAVVVELRSNPVNKQNAEYQNDLHRAFDRLDRDFPSKPAILTASGKVFSAGLDFDYVFPIFSSNDPTRMTAWFEAYKKSMLRVLQSPRLTIAAINGHAFAGGAVLALACDVRIAVEGDERFALNEVPIGIPMPSVYTELIRARLGEPAATEAILLGKAYNAHDAKRLGFVSELVAPERLLPAALAIAAGIPVDSYPAYVCAKASLLAPLLDRMEKMCPALDQETMRVMTSPASVAMHQRTFEKLKNKK